MKIYTSYFGNLKKLGEAHIMPISIARWKPRFYKGVSMYSVAPTCYMLSDECDDNEYLKLYDEILHKRGAKSIIDEIEQLAKGRDVALLCYEKPDDFCHRHLLADFLNNELNIGIKEFYNEVKEHDKHGVQLTLF